MKNLDNEIRLRRRSGQRMHLNLPVAWAKLLLQLVANLKGVLAGLIVAGGCYVALANYGVPAVQYSYDYRIAFGHERYKTMCRYLSPFGMHERAANYGRCAWIVLTQVRSS